MTELARALAARCELLGIEALPLAWLALDALVLAALAGGLVERLERASGEARWGPARTLLAGGLLGLAAIVGAAIVLGAAQRLSASSQLAAHAALLALLVLAERSRGRGAGPRALTRWAARPLAALAAPFGEAVARAGRRRGRRAETALLAGLLAVLGFTLVLALFTPPLNWDSNTYRLSRIAFWLQAGSLDHFPTNDARQNWVGQNAELVMLWLTGFFRREYPLVKLAQWGGGLLAALAAHQLAGWLGMARLWRLGAAVTLVAMPTVGTQLISSQTDLFTAGCLAAGIAFLPAALARGRPGEWLLVGIGVGLAVGAKATVLYWAPGLLLLAAGWAWVERAAWRPLARGGLLAALVALALSGYNFALNRIDQGSAVAPRATLARQAGLGQMKPGSKVATGLVAVAWQLFEPSSNPLVPAAVDTPVFEAVLDWLAERRELFGNVRGAISTRSGLRARGLGEDSASYGLLVALAAALGGLTAVAAALAGGAAERRRAALVALALAVFLVVYSTLSVVGPNQYRYFCLQAPFVALLAADLFARRRGRAGRALGALFLFAQLATAVYVGVASRNQGLRVLLDPATAQWYRNWSETRGLVAELGEEPLRVGLVLPGDAWQAPLLRSGVAHLWLPIEESALRLRPTLGELMADARLDALLVDPTQLTRLLRSAGPMRSARAVREVRRAILRRVDPDSPDGPLVAAVHGILDDRWSETQADFWLSGWSSGRFELGVGNPTPLARAIEIRSRRQAAIVRLAPGARARLAVDVAEIDLVELLVDPPFVPAAHGDRRDVRQLGVLLDPVDRVATDGVDADRWTAPRARFELADWWRGSFELALGNPTPFPRAVRAASSLVEIRCGLAPGERRRLALAVGTHDVVTLEVSPPFVPSRHGSGADDRELGVLLEEIPGDSPAARAVGADERHPPG